MEIKNEQKNNRIFICNSCDYSTSIKSNYNSHILTLKHKNARLEITGNEKRAIWKFVCDECNYNCDKKTNYQRHMTSSKHYKKINELTNNKNKCNNCDKDFSTISGLWKHRKNCNQINEPMITCDAPSTLDGFKPTNGSNDIPFEMVMEVIKQSKEVQNVLIEQNKELQSKLLEKENQLLEQNKDLQNKIIELASKTNTKMINSNNNNTFNLNLFLNEKCKDAMNIVDFINSLQLTTNDFETTGKLGFVNGISKIFISQLKKVDIVCRPLHCTDVKRETVYIKDNDKWEKDNEEKKKLKWAINRVAQLNLNQIQQWQEKYPDCIENNTPANEKFTELALVALGGRGEEEIEKFNDKIMKNVIREIVVDKI
jgi:hypothetical protein